MTKRVDVTDELIESMTLAVAIVRGGMPPARLHRDHITLFAIARHTRLLEVRCSRCPPGLVDQLDEAKDDGAARKAA
jgi:hypothetical protein